MIRETHHSQRIDAPVGEAVTGTAVDEHLQSAPHAFMSSMNFSRACVGMSGSSAPAQTMILQVIFLSSRSGRPVSPGETRRLRRARRQAREFEHHAAAETESDRSQPRRIDVGVILQKSQPCQRPAAQQRGILYQGLEQIHCVLAARRRFPIHVECKSHVAQRREHARAFPGMFRESATLMADENARTSGSPNGIVREVAGQRGSLNFIGDVCRDHRLHLRFPPGGLNKIDRMALEICEGTMTQSAFVSGAQHHAGGLGCFQSFLPPRRTRHQRSPSFSPGKPNCGAEVDRSLPLALEKARKAPVTITQTVWLPTSSGEVSQQPLRKNPVTGLVEQISSGPPKTFREGCPKLPRRGWTDIGSYSRVASDAMYYHGFATGNPEATVFCSAGALFLPRLAGVVRITGCHGQRGSVRAPPE